MAVSNQESDKEKVLSMIKSCLISSKDPLSLDQLQRDYKEIVGGPIPFRQYGFSSLEHFLRSSPKYAYVYHKGASLYAQAPKTEETKHISDLVRGQRRSKSNMFYSKAPLTRRPHFSNWAPPSRPHRPNFMVRRERPFHLPPQEVYRPPHKKHPYNPPRHSNFNPPQNQYKVPPRMQSQINRPQEPVAFKTITNAQVPPATPSTQDSSKKHSKPKAFNNSVTINQKVAREKTYWQQLEERVGSPITKSVVTAGKFYAYFVASVNVNGKVYNSYPSEFKTEAQAIEEAARKALEDLRNSPSASPLTETKDFDLAHSRIKKMLDGNDAGLWWKALVENYSNNYNEKLSDSWVLKAKEICTDISFEWITDQKVILRAKKNSPPSLAPTKSERRTEPPPISYPSDDQWYIHVSYIVDCSNISFKIIGDSYSESLQTLETEMELYYMDHDKLRHPSQLEVDRYYICNFEQSWLRAQVCSIEDGKATVRFIDYGDQETLSTSLVYEIEGKFLELPAQSISASLAGLECYFQEDKALSMLHTMVLGKMLIAQIYAKEEDFISVVLFDTSTDEDININEKLLDTISDGFSEPDLPKAGGICEVYVSHVSDSGEISVQIEYGTYKTLESLLAIIRKQTSDFLGHEDVSIDVTKYYLAKFSEDGEWHRSVPRSDSRNSQGKVLMDCVDSSAQEWVNATNLIALDAKDMLCKVPPQKILVRLVNVPPQPELRWTEKATERLKSLLPKGKPLMLSVVERESQSSPSLVKLFKRIEEDNQLVSINDTLSMDLSLFVNENNNNTLSPEKTSFISKDGSSVDSILSKLLVPMEDLAKMDLPSPPLPSVGSFFDVRVTYAASPSNFAVQPYKYVSKLDLLMGEMSSFYSCEENRSTPGALQVGGFYALLHRDDYWYRVRIDNVNGSFVAGLFVDYGDCFCIANTQNLQPLWRNFRLFPAQAFKAKLGGLSPVNGDWTPEDTFVFQEKVEDKEFVSKILKIHSAGTLPESHVLELNLIDTHDEKIDLYIDDYLIKKGIAVRSSPTS